MIRGIRGAITVTEDNEQQILKATDELLKEMIKKNSIQPEQVAQVIITVTEDLISTFPAKALRNIEGWTYVPVMCMQEIPVKGSLKMCIRVMMTVNTEIEQDKVNHVYLEGATVLRPDLSVSSQ
ncbi:chorismate mutase [Metabacillus halosaccharovorans]|uniref:chorismate mutase n=1 Tax=Metabacillus halosaccharovorans TaxID=930124 RepID=UPI001C2011E4|nr:chorismate mutase [Metabacillus halosaccharovorans]MBU7593299.1 chorismate mutase [Metabacillus halosaccharovorans]